MTDTKKPDAQASECCELLSAFDFEDLANRICKHTPDGCVISVRFENGAAWVELHRDHCPENTPLPDSADKTMLEQINDALLVANGWGT